MFDWNDIRYFLAVVRSGSTLGAGKLLRVSQTTAARRITALEDALGLTLFDRRQAGYLLTPAGEALLAQANGIDAATEAFSEAAGSLQREIAGSVRLTTSELFATTILQPILRDLHNLHPEIRIELDSTDEVLNLGSGAADVALRVAERLEGSGLVGRRIASDTWAIYCSRDYATEHGRPTKRGDLAGHPMIGGGGEGVWKVYRKWLQDNGLEGSVVMHHGSTSGLLAGVRAGVGLAVLPCIVADQDPDLLRCLPPERERTKYGLWLATHERLRHVPRVRILIDYMAERLGKLAH